MFDIDIEKCPHCGGTVKIIAAIENPAVIAKILAHLSWFARHRPEHLRRHSLFLFSAGKVLHAKAFAPPERLEIYLRDLSVG